MTDNGKYIVFVLKLDVDMKAKRHVYLLESESCICLEKDERIKECPAA